MKRIPFACLAALFALSITTVARAQDWTITTADFRSRPALLHGLSTDGVRYTAPGSGDERVIAFDQFVSAQRVLPDASSPRVSPGKFTLLLRNGDRLKGEPAGVAKERLLWRNTALGDVPVQMQRLVELVRGGDSADAGDEPPKQDIVTLANGDSVAGVVTDCSAEQISVRSESGVSSIPLASVTRVRFAAVGGTQSSTGRPTGAFRIKLADGSTVTCVDAALVQERFTISLDSKTAQPIALQAPDVLAVEQLNGPVGWLSSRTPSESVQTPYFGGASSWPARNDATVDGAPLRFGAQAFEHGIGVHAYSRLRYPVEAGWLAFRVQYAIDSRPDEPRALADVTVRVKLDEKVVHEQSHVRAGMLSPVVVIELNGAHTLMLEADYGDAGDTQDHLNWIEPALLRVKPASEPPTTAPTDASNAAAVP